MTAFLDSLDIANRALDHLGLPHILDVNEVSTRNSVMSSVYDKLREAELERNVWKFAKRKVWLRPMTATSFKLTPAQWNVNETYLPGAIVADGNGDLWISWVNANAGNQPGIADAWDSYFGPMAVDQWATGTTYYAGELVWMQSTYAGSFAVYLSMANNNSDTPTSTTAWSATTQYGLGDRAYSGGIEWYSLIANNLNVTPAVGPGAWDSTVTYGAAATVTASDGYKYASVAGANIGIDPSADDGTFWTRGVPVAWSQSPTQFAASSKWLPIFSDLKTFGSEWIYAAPGTVLNGSLNVFHYPNGVERRARVGYRFRNGPDDYEPHGDYITSANALILYEFVANIRDVRKMDAMFCEGLALRIAMGTCKKLTGNTSDVNMLGAEYNKFMNEARTINGIEMGPEEPDEDEYLTVRQSGNGGFTNASTNFWT